ncbi:hypothetical protein HBN84_04805 [Pseudomonas lundensis]|uniref:hypothetical protein n=1 Tax=Pseudomonas lundensis TaxID=86185 RepID=UPI001473C6C5|nr:hypothetical protein [Pseudomonas lundensis]NNA24626.1 hypothetical protein [Pseudomonas lundensis]
MHTTATLHVHPACASKRRLIEQLQATTGCLVILHNHKPRLVPQSKRHTPFDPNNGGHAA